MAGSANINIKQSAYSNAITQLESKLRELENARNDYNELRDQIPDFWSGDAADEAYETIGAAIEQVKTSADAVKENIQAIQKTQEEATQLDTQTQQSIKKKKKAVQSLFE